MKTPKFDDTTMCAECFGKMLRNLPMRKICDLSYVEKRREAGCEHSKTSESTQ